MAMPTEVPIVTSSSPMRNGSERLVDQPRREYGQALPVGCLRTDDGELVSAKTRNNVGLAYAVAQAPGHRLEQFVAGRMTQRIVDSLELIEVDRHQGDFVAAAIDADQSVVEHVAELQAVRQFRQPVVPREIGDAGFGARCLGDVLMCRHPAAIRHRLIVDLQCPPVAQRHLVGTGRSRLHPVLPLLAVVVRIEGRLPGLGTIVHERLQCGAGRGQFGRKPVHVLIAPVADDQTLMRIEHAEPVRHVVERGMEEMILLFEIFLDADVFRDVVMGRHPTAVRHRLMVDLDDAAVLQSDDGVGHLRGHRDIAAPHQILVRRHVRKRASLVTKVHDLLQSCAWAYARRVEIVNFHVTLIADDQPLRAVEEAQALRHVVDRKIELQIADAKFFLLLAGERMLLFQTPLQDPPFRDIFVDRDAAAIRNPPDDISDGAAVGKLINRFRRRDRPREALADVIFRIARRDQAEREPVPDHGADRRAGRRLLGRQAIDVAIRRVAENDPAVLVENDNAVRQIGHDLFEDRIRMLWRGRRHIRHIGRNTPQLIPDLTQRRTHPTLRQPTGSVSSVPSMCG